MLNIAVCLVFVAAASVAPTPSEQVIWTLSGQFILFLTTIAGIFAAIYRENRQRRWQIEDAKALQEKIDKEKVALAEKMDQDKADTERTIRHVGKNVQNTIVLKANEADEQRAEVKGALEAVAAAAAAVKKVEIVNKAPVPVTETNPMRRAIPEDNK